MTLMRSTCLIIWVCLVGLPVFAQETMSYQGNLLNAARQPVSASYPMTFRLYTMPNGGDAVWTEQYQDIAVVDGVFTVDLGGQTPFSSQLATNPSLYLGVSVNDAEEMSPRMKVSAALRARWAAHAKDVRGEHIHPATVSIAERLVINEDAQWVGDPTGLRGPEGPMGPIGPMGPQGNIGPAGPPMDLDADQDMDGFPDWVEVVAGSDPTDDASRPAATGANGVPDALVGHRVVTATPDRMG